MICFSNPVHAQGTSAAARPFPISIMFNLAQSLLQHIDIDICDSHLLQLQTEILSHETYVACLMSAAVRGVGPQTCHARDDLEGSSIGFRFSAQLQAGVGLID